MTLRRFAPGLLAFLFISVLVFGPELASAKRFGDERPLKSKPEKSAEERTASEIRETKRNERDTRSEGRPNEQRGNLARFAGFIKKLFVGEQPKASGAQRDVDEDSEENDDDLPGNMRGRINRQEYLEARQEWVNSRLGMTPGIPYDASLRSRAIEQMTAQRADLQARARKILHSGNRNKSIVPLIASNSWTEIGPKPIPNGQTSTVNQPVAGRTVAIAIHPTNPNIVYVGGAQAGVYRSLNGGQTWTPIFDSAQSLVIGALALAPSNPEILYVGTGEAGQCGSGCYAGIGVYRIDNASTTATLTGPINPLRNYNDASSNPVSANVFTGRAISKILVTPTDPSVIFVATASAIIGNPNQSPQGGTVPPAGIRGIYRLANATGPAAGVTATKLTVNAVNCFDTPCTGNHNIMDMVFDPADATGNTILCWARPAAVVSDGGVFLTTTAQTTATFTQTLAVTQAANNRGELASVNIGGTTTVYLASGEQPSGSAGRLRKSTDGGLTWSAALLGAVGFCGGQCFYDIAIAIDPTNADIAYVGGAAGSNILRKTTDGFATVANTPSRQTGLHADNHALAVAAAPNNNIIYDGTDGGIWRSDDSGATWQSLNNSTYSATQFQSIAVHPTDRYFTIGGSQDNGSHMWKANNEGEKPITDFSRIDFGDGGYARIDQTATDTTNVVMYHTYFNQTSGQIGFARVSQTTCASEGQWAFKGASTSAGSPNACGDASGANGMTITDAVQFYAPLELGPPVLGSQGNTVYFGTDRLYRSINKGDVMTLASQTPIVAGQTVTTIAISPQDDNYRVVGLTNGQIWGTASGSIVLTNITPVGAPARLVGKLVFDPTNKDVAYAAYGGQGITATQHIWKTTNFSAVTPTWTATANGIPDISVNALAVDPSAPSNAYAGTDVGVFVSTDGGATWNPYGTGLPAIAVFDMAIQDANRFLRIATHGRGWWEISLVPAGGVSISGTVTVTGAPDNSGVTVLLNEGEQSTVTDPTGTYSFTGLDAGGNYTVRPELSSRTFTPSYSTFNDITASKTNVNFTGAVSTNAAPVAGSVIISEFREQGPNGDNDDFVELYNNTNSNITVTTGDGSPGWALVGSGFIGTAPAGISLFQYTIIPNGTVIPARGHLLVVGPTYSIRGYAAGDLNLSGDIPTDTGIGLFNTANSGSWNLSNLLDSVGFTSDPFLGEGTRLSPMGSTSVEHAFVRSFDLDTNNNASDFVLVSPTGGSVGSLTAALGAPGPSDLASPLNDNAAITGTLVDGAAGAGASPNRVRCPTCISTNATFGTLLLSRRFTNNTGQTITRLRFRVKEITTLNNPEGQSSPADLRLLSSATSTFSTAPCVQGTMVEQPVLQSIGGGLNTSVAVDLSGDLTTNCNDDGNPGLSNGEGVNVQWVLGVQTTGNYRFLVEVEALPHGGSAFFVSGNTEVAAPTAASVNVSGNVTNSNGSPLAGAVVRLNGASLATTITNSEGGYSFKDIPAGGFYTVTPELANYHFSPANRSFSLVADRTNAIFTATADAAVSANAIDSAEYFVRQQYVDFLGREPEAGGFNYWSEQVNQCHGDTGCERARRIDISAAFFMSREFQDTGSYIYRLYRGALGRQLRYNEFSVDRAQVVGGSNLETSKAAFANAFVQRTEFTQKYQASTGVESFVDALLQTMHEATGVDASGERASLINRYDAGHTMNESRALVIRELVDNASFMNRVYNESFVAMQYFGYLRRNPDQEGYNFWLDVMNSTGDHRGMVCSFLTSAEYQRRFSTLVTRSNAECGQ